MVTACESKTAASPPPAAKDSGTPNHLAAEQNEMTSNAATVSLKREVGLFSAVSLLVGCVIGSGIFVTPSGVFRNSGSVGVDLAVWIASGIMTAIGGACYAELGSLLPASGGDYAFLTAAGRSLGRFGDAVPFLFSWCFVLFLDPMSTAIQGLTFSSYGLSIFYPGCSPPYSVKIIVAFLFISKFISLPHGWITKVTECSTRMILAEVRLVGRSVH